VDSALVAPFRGGSKGEGVEPDDGSSGKVRCITEERG